MSWRSLSFPCKLLAGRFPHHGTTVHEYSQVFPVVLSSHPFSHEISKIFVKIFPNHPGIFSKFLSGSPPSVCHEISANICQNIFHIALFVWQISTQLSKSVKHCGFSDPKLLLPKLCNTYMWGEMVYI